MNGLSRSNFYGPGCVAIEFREFKFEFIENRNIDTVLKFIQDGKHYQIGYSIATNLNYGPFLITDLHANDYKKIESSNWDTEILSFYNKLRIDYKDDSFKNVFTIMERIINCRNKSDFGFEDLYVFKKSFSNRAEKLLYLDEFQQIDYFFSLISISQNVSTLTTIWFD